MAIIGLLDADGVSVVKYECDAWGKPLDCTGIMAATLGADNPFRYRGYVYGEETGLYYLRSRYYNPWWGRFVNADDVTWDFVSRRINNCFEYCFSCPIMYCDADGNSGTNLELKKGWYLSGIGAIMTKPQRQHHHLRHPLLQLHDQSLVVLQRHFQIRLRRHLEAGNKNLRFLEEV